MEFAPVLHGQLLLNPPMNKGKLGRLVKRADNATPTKRRKIYARMEAHARIHLGLKPNTEIDWTSKGLDWTGLLSFLTALLPILLALFGL